MRLIRLEKATKEQGRENSLRSLEFVRRSAGFVSKLQSKTLSSGQWYFRLFYSSCITSFVLLLFQGSLSSRAMESALCRLSSFSFGYARTCTVPVCTVPALPMQRVTTLRRGEAFAILGTVWRSLESSPGPITFIMLFLVAF